MRSSSFCCWLRCSLVWKRAGPSLELFLFLLVVAAAAVAGAALLSRIISGGMLIPGNVPNLIAAARLSRVAVSWHVFVVFRQIIIRFCHILSYLFFRLIVV